MIVSSAPAPPGPCSSRGDGDRRAGGDAFGPDGPPEGGEPPSEPEPPVPWEWTATATGASCGSERSKERNVGDSPEWLGMEGGGKRRFDETDAPRSRQAGRGGPE
jgi:hypothetical protein